MHVAFQGRSPDQMWGFRKIEAALLPKSVEEGSRKVHVDLAVARTKTDTGRRGEYPQALERTAVKELGNFAP